MTDTNAADESQLESGYANAEPAEMPIQQESEVEVSKPVAVDPMQELRDQIAKLEARTRNAEGHIGGLNHQQKLMQETVQAAAKAATQQVSDAPTQSQVKAAMTNPAEWDALKTDFPEWANATEKFMDARLAALKTPQALDSAAIDKIVSERVAGQTAEVRKEIVNASLDAVFPGWLDDIKTPAFKAWQAAQPAAILSLFESEKVSDAARALRLYEQSKQAKPAPQKEVSTRQKRIEAAVTPKGTGGHAAGRTELDDFESGYL